VRAGRRSGERTGTGAGTTRPGPRAAARAVRETVAGLPGQFWWLWTSTLINRLGGFVVTFLALYLTVQRGYSASYAGLVAALYGLGGAGGAVVGGVLADRLGRRITLLTAQMGTALATAVLGLVTGPLSIAGVTLLVGLSGNASRPALQAMIADLVPPADRVRAFSLNYWAANIGFGVSAAVAGFIAAEGYLWLFAGDALTTVLCAAVVFAKVRETLPGRPAPRPTARPAQAQAQARPPVQAPAPAPAPKRTRTWTLTRAAETPAQSARTPAASTPAAAPAPGPRLADVLRDHRFMAVVALTFLFGAVMQQASSTLAVDMGDHGLSARQFGLIAAINGIEIVLLQIPVTRLVRGRSPAVLLAGGALLLSWGLGLTVFAGSVALYAVTVAFWTLGEILHAPASMAVVADLAPTAARGRYQGMYTLSWSAAAFAGPLTGGLVLDHLGRDAVWAGCALAGTVSAAGYYALLRPRPATAAVTVPPVQAQAQALTRDQPQGHAPEPEPGVAPVPAAGPAGPAAGSAGVAPITGSAGSAPAPAAAASPAPGPAATAATPPGPRPSDA
jgi:MFS family permease